MILLWRQHQLSEFQQALNEVLVDVTVRGRKVNDHVHLLFSQYHGRELFAVIVDYASSMISPNVSAGMESTLKQL